MLTSALATVRELTDEAIAAEETRAAAQFSRLASTLEKAVSRQQQVAEEYVARADIDRSTTSIIETFCAVAESVLPEDQFAVFEAALSTAIPSPVIDDEFVVALRKEFEQVAELFAAAVEAKLVGDIVRIGGLLVVKSKALTKAEIRAGALLNADDVRLLALPILDASKAARKAIGADAHNAVLDVFVPHFSEVQTDGD